MTERGRAVGAMDGVSLGFILLSRVVRRMNNSGPSSLPQVLGSLAPWRETGFELFIELLTQDSSLTVTPHRRSLNLCGARLKKPFGSPVLTAAAV